MLCTMPVREKSGKLFFDFWVNGKRAKTYTGLDATPENWKLCNAKMREIERDLARGTFDYRAHFPTGNALHVFYPDDRLREGAATLFSDYIEQWHRDRSPIRADGSVIPDADIHPSTWLHDGTTVRSTFTPFFGHMRIGEIRSEHTLAFRRWLFTKGLSGKTVGNYMGLLHKVFDDAVAEGLISVNPVVRTSSRKVQRGRKRPRTSINPLKPDQVLRFLEVVDPWYRDLYEVWFNVGWRSDEIVATRFGWLDFERQMVVVKLGRYRGYEAEPKTGEREIDCSHAPAIFAAFARLRERQASTGPDDYVFTSPEGKPLHQEWLNENVFKPALERAGIPYRGQYCIRDTFCTWALSAGEDPGWVARVCGNSEEMIKIPWHSEFDRVR